jgi:predicted metal-dependent phosphoesterase TrpH
VDGSVGYGDELSYSDYRMLKWLKERNAVSPETSEIVINEGKVVGREADSYQRKIVEVFNLRSAKINIDEKARKIYRKHVFKRWIDSKQVDKYESRVWITKAGMELVEHGMFYEDREKRAAVIKEYRKMRLAKSAKMIR